MYCFYVFFFKQKTAYEMRISDWSSDVCSSDLEELRGVVLEVGAELAELLHANEIGLEDVLCLGDAVAVDEVDVHLTGHAGEQGSEFHDLHSAAILRSEEHTSELQSLMRISYAVFCLKKKKQHIHVHFT